MVTCRRLVCGVLLAGAGCGFFRAEEGVSVTVAQVTTRQTSPEVTVAATLIPSDQAVIRFPRKVTVAAVRVRPGDVVSKGAVVLTLDGAALAQERDLLRAEWREAESQLKMQRASPSGVLPQEQILRQSTIEAGEATVARLQAALTVAESALGRLDVTAPIDGLVVRTHATAQQELAADAPLLEIVRVDPLFVSFSLTADLAGGIVGGNRVSVRVDELGGETRTASVRYIEPALHPSDRAFTVWAELPNPDGRLKVGMNAFAEFRSSHTQRVYVVPASAMVLRNRQPHLFVIDDGVARLRRVTVKRLLREQATLVSGVRENEWVAVQGQEGLQDGMIVDMR